MDKINSYITLKDDVNEIEKHQKYTILSSRDKKVIVYPSIVVNKVDIEEIEKIITKAHSYKIYVRSENANDINIIKLGIDIGQIPDDFMKGIN